MIKVSPSLVTRSVTQFLALPCDVDVILGVNGWIWISKHVPKLTEEEMEESEIVFSDENLVIINY